MFTDLEKVALIIPPTFISVLLSIYLIYGLIKYSPKNLYVTYFIMNTTFIIISLTTYIGYKEVGILFAIIWGIISFCILLMLWLSNKYSLKNISKLTYLKKIPIKLQKILYIFLNLSFIYMIYVWLMTLNFI